MCVVSMIMDHYHNEWWRRYYTIPAHPLYPYLPQPMQPAQAPPRPAELDEFRRLLERAREYDKAHNEPDCELEEKRARIKKLAEELGVKVDFV